VRKVLVVALAQGTLVVSKDQQKNISCSHFFKNFIEGLVITIKIVNPPIFKELKCTNLKIFEDICIGRMIMGVHISNKIHE